MSTPAYTRGCVCMKAHRLPVLVCLSYSEVSERQSCLGVGCLGVAGSGCMYSSYSKVLERWKCLGAGGLGIGGLGIRNCMRVVNNSTPR
jgi:hypothetical protein